MLEDLLVPQLVCYGESQRQACVLVDAAAAMGLAHSGHMRQPQRLTRLIGSSTDVFPVSKSSVRPVNITARSTT